MRLVIEFDGVIADVRAAYVRAHREAAEAVGWPAVEAGAFWRMIRKGGPEAVVLRGARPVKLKEYRRAFAERLHSADVVRDLRPHDGALEAVDRLAKLARIYLVTLSANSDTHRQLAADWGLTKIGRLEGLDSDPRRRPGELKVLARDEPRAVVVAGDAPLIRSATEAGLIAVGMLGGAAIEARLHQAGASIVFPNLTEVGDDLASGSKKLVAAGLLPPGL